MKKFLTGCIVSLLFIAGCENEDGRCKEFTELTDRDHLVDLKKLEGAPELLHTLALNPQLQVYQVMVDEYAFLMRCHVFFDDLKSFSDDLVIMKFRKDGRVHNPKPIPANPGISNMPTLSYNQAIDLARHEQNFEGRCIQYRLGIYNTNAGKSGKPPAHYVLTWKVQGENDFPYVIIDANTSEVYDSDSGIRY